VPARTGPTFTRPPIPDTGEATRRRTFETLLDWRATELDARPELETTNLLRALVREFVEAVERANSSRALLRQTPLDYVDAVVIDGANGQLIVDAVEYDAAPVHWQARVGEVERVVHGADLDAYLRTGEHRYATRLGLA
jgi:hypothetical protein